MQDNNKHKNKMVDMNPNISNLDKGQQTECPS